MSCTQILAAALILGACTYGQASAQGIEELKRIVAEQLFLTAQGKPVYEKQVRQMDIPGQPEEIQRFRLVPALENKNVRMISQEKVVGDFVEEFSVAWDLLSTDPKLRGFFDFAERGDTLVATRRPDAKSQMDLVRQELVFQSAQEGKPDRLLYLKSEIVRRSSFYSSRFTVCVRFRSDGRYLNHSLSFGSELFLLGPQGTVAIEGRLLN